MTTQTEQDCKYWITLNQIQGYIAMWAVRQSPYHNPDGLGDVLHWFRNNVVLAFDKNSMAQMDRKDLLELLKKHLLPIPQVQKWNERKNGNQAPYAFVDRYSRPAPDDDFIDLDALIRNVAVDSIRECERDHCSDMKPATPPTSTQTEPPCPTN